MNYKVTDTELTATANAIRTKGNTVETIEWKSGEGFADAIDALPDGGGSVSTAPNDNLCCNWDFTNAVNTRAYSSYSTGNSAIFTIDGWKLWRGAINVSSNGIIFRQNYTASDAGIFQQWPSSSFVTALLNKTVTVSALLGDTLISDTGTLTSNTGELVSATHTYDDGKIFKFYIYRDSSTSMTFNIYIKPFSLEEYSPLIKAVKIEIGETQTLAEQVNGVWVLTENQNKDNEYVRVRAMVSN